MSTSLEVTNGYNYVMLDPSVSWTAENGCNSCSPIADVHLLTPSYGPSQGKYYYYEYEGSIITDTVCLVFDPNSSTCVTELDFFAVSDDKSQTNIWRPYLGLSPIDELNGQSYV